MMLRSISGKSRLALVLALLAALSYAYSLSSERWVRAGIADIPFAIALDDRVRGGFEMFLKVDGVTGDSNDSIGKHRNEIDIDSYAWDVSRPSGKPTLNVFRVTMPAGRASPKLLMNAAGGVKIQRVVLSVRTKGADQDFLKWILTDAKIASYGTVGNIHGDGIEDQISFSFGKIEVEYAPAEGGATVKAGWDQRTGGSVGN